jgi:hypothetical protein
MPEENSILDERRVEPRLRAEGRVTLRLFGAMPTNIPGRLVDTASTGFRAWHGARTLATGQIVEFDFEGGHGRARVAWTRILGEEVESGFLILTRSKARSKENDM